MTGPQQPTDSTPILNQRLDVDFALEAAGLGIWEYDPLTGQANWDERCRALYGLNKGNTISYEQAFQYIHPDDAKVVKEAVAKVLTPPSDGRYDVTFRTIGGDDAKMRWVRFQGKAQFTANGEAQRLGGVAQDVTQQVLDHQKVEASETHLQLLRDTVPAMIFHLDLEQRYQSYNGVFRDWFGVEGDQAIGKTVREFLGEEAYQQTQPHLAKAYSGQVERYELYAPSGMNTDRWLSIVYTPHKAPDGNVTGVLVHATDITQSKRAELELRASEARFRSLVEEAPVATCLFVGPQMRIELANQAMIQVWGKGPDVIGLPLAEALPELKNQHFLTTLDDLFTTGNTYEAKGGRADLVIAGKLQTYYFNYDFKPLRNTEGEVYAILETATDVTQQVLAQKRIEQSQRQLLDLFEQSPVGLATYSADDEYVIQWANPFFGELVARPLQDIIGKPLLEALPELKGQGFNKLLKNVIATGTPFIAPERMVDILRDGELTTIYVDLTYQPRKGPQGDVESILVVATDVTQQVLARQKIEESERFSRTIFYNSPVAKLVYIGPEMVLQEANEKMLAIFGRDASIIGQPIMKAIPELNRTQLLEKYRRILVTGEILEERAEPIELIKNGESYWGFYDYTYKPLVDLTGKAYGVICTAIEVTEQVMARQQREEAEASLRGAIELAQLGTWSIDVATQGLVFSNRMIEWFGYDPKAQPYREVIPILEAGDQERVDRAVAWALNPESNGVYDEIFTVVHPQTGLKRILHAHGKTVFDEMGKAVRMNGTAQDITLQQELQLALEQQVQQRTEELATTNEELAATNEELAANNEEYAAINEELEEANFLLSRSNDNLQQFAYVASHDLQEPLRKIQQFGDLLRTRYSTASHEELGYLDRMQSAAVRMSVLIKDLLNYSRITSQRDTNSRVDLNQVVDDVLIDLELLRAETQARIDIDPLPVVEGDVGQLGQLFQNLLSNAIKFRRSGIAPSIQIKSEQLLANQLPTGVKPARTASSYHQIKVADNGVGFDEKYLDRIFQVFQRLHGKSEYAGTGIGLAVCEKVVTNHGGSITATSQVGQGATFTIYLPV